MPPRPGSWLRGPTRLPGGGVPQTEACRQGRNERGLCKGAGPWSEQVARPLCQMERRLGVEWALCVPRA